jgi:hypothetical protein
MMTCNFTMTYRWWWGLQTAVKAIVLVQMMIRSPDVFSRWWATTRELLEEDSPLEEDLPLEWKTPPIRGRHLLEEDLPEDLSEKKVIFEVEDDAESMDLTGMDQTETSFRWKTLQKEPYNSSWRMTHRTTYT